MPRPVKKKPSRKKKAPARRPAAPAHEAEIIKLSVAMLPARFDRTEGFLDLVLSIATVSSARTGATDPSRDPERSALRRSRGRVRDLDEGGDPWRLEARGGLGGKSLAVEVVLRAGMRPGITEDEGLDGEAFYPRGVVLRSLGPETTNLVRALAGAYGVAHEGGQAAPSLALTAFAMRGDPRRLDQEEVRFKAFREARGQRAYELYVHVDLPRRRLTLREKDEAWRVPLIRAWLR